MPIKGQQLLAGFNEELLSLGDIKGLEIERVASDALALAITQGKMGGGVECLHPVHELIVDEPQPALRSKEQLVMRRRCHGTQERCSLYPLPWDHAVPSQ